jgi:hypothetical protein
MMQERNIRARIGSHSLFGLTLTGKRFGEAIEAKTLQASKKHKG